MLIPIEELSSFYQTQPSGVLHVAAHSAEEERSISNSIWTAKVKFIGSSVSLN
jgi:hypothetical protein